MIVVIDSIAVSFNPEVIELWHNLSPDTAIEVIDSFLSPARFAHHLSQLRPDVLVVAPIWLTITSLLFKVLELSGNSTIPRVIGTNECTDVLKIQAAHHRYSDVLDLNASPQLSFNQLVQNHHGSPALDSDEVWNRVPRPLLVPDLTNVPRDAIDVQILNLITIGLRDQDMASTLYISLQTVKNRVSRMLEISGTENRTQLGYLYSNRQLVAAMLMNIENEYATICQ